MRSKIIFFLIFLLIFIVVFRSLIFNLPSHLIDWRDYALMVWIIEQNISHILSLNFFEYFQTSAFYPHPYSLLFSDLLIPQAVIALPFYLISNNLILGFNILFILTFILNYLSSFLLWRLLFKKDILAFTGSLLLIFSPFFYLEISHFQMMSYWPLMFSLYFLIRDEFKSKLQNILLSALFLVIQFLASVYLAVFLLTIILFYFLINYLFLRKLKLQIKNFLIIILVFFTVCGIFIKGYFDMRNHYQVNREIEEYIRYSAQVSDYVFTTPINSIIHKSAILNKWNNSDKNVWGGKAAFPGFLLTGLSLFSIIKISKEKKLFLASIELDRYRAFFLGLVVIGFIFSLGPRVSFNGTYAHIPLPYTLLLKYVPFFESVRAESRWSYLIYFGLIYFALLTLSRAAQSKYFKYYLSSFLLIFIVEYLPLNIKTGANDYTEGYSSLKSICSQERKVVLEVPVTHLNAGGNIVEGLTYITTAQLASTYHNCYLVNGYSGYDLPENIDLDNQLNNILKNQDVTNFLKLVKGKGIDFIKVNRSQITKPLQEDAQKFVEKLRSDKNFKEVEDGIFELNTQ